jgi:hypothetical protein
MEALGDPVKVDSHECVALSPDGKTLALVGRVLRDGVDLVQVVRFWDVGNIDKAGPREVTLPPDKLLEFGKHVHGVSQLEFTGDGSSLAALTRDGPGANDSGHVWL